MMENHVENMMEMFLCFLSSRTLMQGSTNIVEK